MTQTDTPAVATLAIISPDKTALVESACAKLRDMERRAAGLLSTIRTKQSELIRLRFEEGKLVTALSNAGMTHAAISHETGANEWTISAVRAWYRHWNGDEGAMLRWLESRDETATWTEALALAWPSVAARQERERAPLVITEAHVGTVGKPIGRPAPRPADRPKTPAVSASKPAGTKPATEAPGLAQHTVQEATEEPDMLSVGIVNSSWPAPSYRAYLTFHGNAAFVVGKVLGDDPAERILELCRAELRRRSAQQDTPTGAPDHNPA